MTKSIVGMLRPKNPLANTLLFLKVIVIVFKACNRLLLCTTSCFNPTVFYVLGPFPKWIAGRN